MTLVLSALNARDYAFPLEFVPVKQKEKNAYGLQYAKAIFNMGTRYGGGRFYNSDQEFDALTELAQGRQSVSDLKKIFGYQDSPNSVDNTKELAWIDPRVLNLATKYVNRAVAKMQRIKYDIGLECIDIVAIEEKKDYAAAIQTFYQLKKWYKDMGINAAEVLQDLDIQGLPEYPEEMLYDITTNPKIKKEIAGELFIKLINAINRMNMVYRMASWDLVVYGRCHIDCYNDNNGVPRAKRIHPKFYEGSYVENDDFEEQEYAAYYDFLTVNQFIKETSGQFNQEEQMRIVQAYSFKSNIGSFVDYKRVEAYDGLGYIPVMRFAFRSEDNRTYVDTENSLGRRILVEKSPDYVPQKDNQRVITNTYTSVYRGTWVVDSEVVYNYKREEYPRMHLVDASLPIKTFATNYREGRCVSFLAQMAEPIFMINTAWNKIKQILAEGRMGVMEIDFSQIEDVAMGAGGKKWTPADVLRFLFKKNILIKRGKVNQYEQKVANAIEMNTGGLQLSDYFTAFTTGIQMLEQMTASSVLEQSNVPDRLTSQNAEASQELADIDMEYLFNAREYMIERVSHQLLLLGQGSLAKKKNIEGFIPALGKFNTGFYQASPDIAYCEYGMFLQRQASAQERADFLMDVSLAVKEGRISPADSAYVREIDNLKQARQILAIREQIFQKRQQDLMQQQQQMQMEAASDAAANKFEADMMSKDKDGQIKGELIKLQGQINQLLQAQKGADAKEVKKIDAAAKRDNQARAGQDSIMKQAVHNNPYNKKANVEAARMDIEYRKLQQEDRKLDQEDERIAIERSKPKPAAK